MSKLFEANWAATKESLLKGEDLQVAPGRKTVPWLEENTRRDTMVVYDIYEKGVLVGKFNATLNLPSTDCDENVMICGGTWSMRPDFAYSRTCEVRYENGTDAINQGFTNLGDNNLLFEVKS